MNEREKMLNGYIYDPFCDGLPEDRNNAHNLCRKYNSLPETDFEKRNAILKELLPDLKEGVYLQGPIQFDYGKYTHIGKNSYANFNFVVVDCAEVNIGENVFIGPNVTIACPIHPLRYQDRNLIEKNGYLTDREYAKPVTIGNNCWICSNVTIIGGVKIGEGCVIGAGSVVTRDIPPNSLAFGVPCRVIREITEKDGFEHHPELFAKE